MDMLHLVEYFLENENLYDTLIFYGEVFIKGILIKCIEWWPSIPNVKIREGALICMRKLIEWNLIEGDVLYQNFNEIFDNVKNCLDDEHYSSIWFVSTVFMGSLIDKCHEELDYEDYKNVYPELIKRLDDS